MKKRRISTPLLIGILLAVGVSIALPYLFSSNYYIQVFSQTLINLVALLGLNVVMGLAGQSNLGTIGLVGIGSYATALLAVKLGATNLWAVPLIFVVAVIAGLVLGYPSLRVNGIFLTLVTLAFAQIVYILAINMQWLTGGDIGVKGYDLPNLFGWQLTSQRQLYYVILAVSLLLIWLSTRLHKSKFGRALKAVKDNPEAVESVGLSVTKLKMMAFLIATTLGCLSGMFYAWTVLYVAPSAFTTDNSTRYSVMLMLGGIGSTPGMIIGAVLVTILPEALRFLGDYYQFIFYSIALLLLLLYPAGLSHLFSVLGKQISGIIGRKQGLSEVNAEGKEI